MRQAARGQSFASRRFGYDWKCQGSERLCRDLPWESFGWQGYAKAKLSNTPQSDGKAKQSSATASQCFAERRNCKALVGAAKAVHRTAMQWACTAWDSRGIALIRKVAQKQGRARACCGSESPCVGIAYHSQEMAGEEGLRRRWAPQRMAVE